MGQKIVCTDCRCERESEDGICPNCGSTAITVELSLSDKMSIDESLRGKIKEVGKKKPIKEFKYGADYNRDREKMVDRTLIVDRENNQYHEKVVDRQSGAIIHECSEPLDKHYGHGNAKNKD